MLNRFFLLSLLFFFLHMVRAQQPFTCEDQFFLTLSGNVASLNEVIIDPISKTTAFRTIRANLTSDINAIGYRVTDNFIYGIDPSSLSLLRLDATGNVEILKTLSLSKLNAYFAADITPDGRYLVVLGSVQLGSGSALTTEVIKIDLNDPNYGISAVVINRTSRIFDIAFHPVTGLLYGYDADGQRLVIINPETGALTYPYPSSGQPFVTGSLFFDAYGNLFAYGSNSFSAEQNSLYLINANTGQSSLIATGAIANASDGCSCPYTIELSKSVMPKSSPGCSDVEYTFTITNASARPHSGITLKDILPPGFTFLEVVKNPLTSTVTSLPGATQFEMTNITLPQGEHKIVIRVNTGNASPGTYQNQAVLSNIPQSLGSRRLSDDLSTIVIDDSTSLEIIGLPFKTISITTALCNTEPNVELSAASQIPNGSENATYLWDNGQTTPTIEVDKPGTYSVTLTLGCDTAVATYQVINSSVTASISTQKDQTIVLGQTVEINAEVTSSEPLPSITWSDPQGSSLTCLDCLNPIARPFNDINYVLTAQNALGCVARDSIAFRVDKNRDVYFPTAFKPDSPRSNNSYFYPLGDAYTIVQDISVYSRWGELLYRKNNLNLNDIINGWDGKHRDKDMNPGVYVWFATLKFLDGFVETRSGDITLVR
jgi:CHU_C Type IX secretion signal domain/Domain of unknown function DUF11